MNNFLISIFLLVNTVAFSQTQSDTNKVNQRASVVFLKNGQVIDNCLYIAKEYISDLKDFKGLYILTTKGDSIKINVNDIDEIIYFNPQLTVYDQKYNLKLAGVNLKKFSTRFVGGALISLAGSMAVIVGAITMQKNDKMKYLMYSGCALSGIGIIVSISSFTKSYKAGQYLENYPIYKK